MIGKNYVKIGRGNGSACLDSEADAAQMIRLYHLLITLKVNIDQDLYTDGTCDYCFDDTSLQFTLTFKNICVLNKKLVTRRIVFAEIVLFSVFSTMHLHSRM